MRPVAGEPGDREVETTPSAAPGAASGVEAPPAPASSYPGLPGPPPGWAPAGGPGRRPERRPSGARGTVRVVVATGVVGVLIVAGAVVLLVSGGGEPSPPSAMPLQREEEPTGWQRPTAEATTGVATDGEMACATGGRELFCVDAATGDELWSEELPAPGTPPAIVGDTVVVAADSSGGDVRGYSPDGDLRWESAEVEDVELDPAELGVAAPPPVAGGTVAVSEGDAGTDARMVGIDVETGEEVWRGGADGLSSTAWPVSDGERFYGTTVSFTMDGSVEPTWVLVAVDGATGSERWRFDVGATPVFVDTAVPVAGGEAVALLLGGETERVVVLDATSGELLWETPLASDQASVAHVDGVTVVVDGTRMRGVDDDGVELWSVAAPGAGNPSDPSAGAVDLVALDGRLFAHRLDVFEVDPSAGESHLLQDMVLVDGLALVADHLIVAGEGLRAFPLEE